MTIAGIEIELVRKRIKNVHLRIYPPEGRVRVSAPHRTSETFIADFVSAKVPWIRKQQARIAALPPTPELSYTDGEEHVFLGQPHTLVLHKATGRPSVTFDSTDSAASIIHIHAREPQDAQAVERLLKRAYRRELQRLLDAYIPKWEEALGVRSTNIRIRAMKRKWGACRPRTADIVFNLELIKHPPICTDYVVLHELAHLLEGSHNARFQAILTQHMPNWREVEGMLNGRTAS
ncbi:MAG: SprT family zinc-dependent metalloprotease [Flavobacteriales bacterium]|nr:SprT family zinc-dependent metalloprotease [Flavobacteriales bacterium]